MGLATWDGKLNGKTNRISRKPTVAEKLPWVFRFKANQENNDKNTRMKSRLLTDVDFEVGNDFELYPTFERAELHARFAELKGSLVGALLDDNETLALQSGLESAANEAAALAWTTDYPLLVFPVLLDEYARRERVRQTRQLRIQARSQKLMECAAV